MNRFSIGSDNGLALNRRPAIISTNTEIFSIGPLGTNFTEILVKIQHFYSRIWTWNHRLRNGGHFVQGEIPSIKWLPISRLNPKRLSALWRATKGLGFSRSVFSIFELWLANPTINLLGYCAYLCRVVNDNWSCRHCMWKYYSFHNSG